MAAPPDAALAAALEGAILLEASRLATARHLAAVEAARRPEDDDPPFLAVALLGVIDPARRGYSPAEWVWMEALDKLGFAVERWSWERGG